MNEKELEQFNAESARKLYTEENYIKELNHILRLIKEQAPHSRELILASNRNALAWKMFYSQEQVLSEVLAERGFTVNAKTHSYINGEPVRVVIISWAKTKEEK
ncbi:hypothetical protein EFP01_129 [Enterococcus phage EFP01]|uniref:Uncharacterized protein n=1 Tax=Enterococcus phage EFP01 TaxID=1926594 RepID=A0A288TXX2_9CAUD|nr:hypothetical protein HOR47_gp129 [Enterococcus phage EFP01]APZ82056.1 hypothetical protein EFP01_129 [Enterococcus phage EFP01]